MDAETHINVVSAPTLPAPDELGTPATLVTKEPSHQTPIQSPHRPSTDIAAYFALEFVDMQYIYYLQRWSVSLGRSDAAADIDLGPLKNVSRLHARIEYEEELERFVLAVIGRNGAFVDGTWMEPGRRVPLGQRTLIQISTRAFYFILPTQTTPTEHHDDEEGHLPGLDSTVTTADDSRSPSTTPKQQMVLTEHGLSPATLKLGANGKGRGKGKGVWNDLSKPIHRTVASDADEDTDAQDEDMEDEPVPISGLGKSKLEWPKQTASFTDDESSDEEMEQVPSPEPIAVDPEPLPPRRVTKRKREVADDYDEEDEPSPKKKKGVKGRKKAQAPAPRSLFTTEPAAPLSAVVAEAGAENKKSKPKPKALSKKAKAAAAESAKAEEGEKEDETKTEEPKEEPKPAGPPPPKPPFTYPLLCYRALKALNGKAPYRAITKWLETEYPYFALATKEGKDGWENSTRHTLSSHKAFIKIDRKPEERGKGCFWSFDPEFEIQFADQWQAALSNSRNPNRQVQPKPAPPPGPSHGRPPYPHPWMPHPPPPAPGQGVTPPHLMPGYRPMPPPHGGPFYPPVPSRLPIIHPSPSTSTTTTTSPNASQTKPRPPKKPKQALGAAFSRAPLIRPGLGGVPANPPFSNGPLVRKTPEEKEAENGARLVRMAARVAKDEANNRAPPGSALAAATGWYHPLGRHPPSIPAASAKISVVQLATMPTEATRPPLPPGMPAPPNGEPIGFWEGKLYLNPKSYPQLGEEDVGTLANMTVADIMNYLVGKTADAIKEIPSGKVPLAPAITKGDDSPKKVEKDEEAKENDTVE